MQRHSFFKLFLFILHFVLHTLTFETCGIISLCNRSSRGKIIGNWHTYQTRRIPSRVLPQFFISDRIESIVFTLCAIHALQNYFIPPKKLRHDWHQLPFSHDEMSRTRIYSLFFGGSKLFFSDQPENLSKINIDNKLWLGAQSPLRIKLRSPEIDGTCSQLQKWQ